MNDPSPECNELRLQAAARLRDAGGDRARLREAILWFVRAACAAGMVPSETTDLFCVSTPSVVESAGLEGGEADGAVRLFDEVHTQILRGG